MIQAIAVLIGAVITVFFSGIFLESYKRHRDLQGVASAIAGEIFSIIHLTERREHPKQFARLLAQLEAGATIDWPDITGGDPTQDDPVIKSNLERIGLIPGNLPERITTFYSYVRGIRIDLVHLSKGVFKEPQTQASIIRADLILWSDAVQLGNSLWVELRNLSTAPWWFHALAVRWKDRFWAGTRACVLWCQGKINRLRGLAVQYGSAPQQAITDVTKPASPDEALPTAQNASQAARNSLQAFEPQYRELVGEIANNLDNVVMPTVMQHFAGNRELALRHMLIDFQSAIYLERASRFLYGSQIDALIFLGTNNSRGTKDDLRRFYDAGKAKSPDIYQNYSFDHWLHYIESQGLVRTEGDVVSLEPGGKAIISYMQRRGYLTLRAPG